MKKISGLLSLLVCAVTGAQSENKTANFVEFDVQYEKEEQEYHLNELSNDDLLQYAVSKVELTPLELELFLRLEQYVAMYGDYLTKVV